MKIKSITKLKVLAPCFDVADVVPNHNYIVGPSRLVAHNCNFLEVIEESKRGLADSEDKYDAAEEMYDAIYNRHTSRFMKPDGSLPGLICFCSSPRYPNDFTSRMRKRAQLGGYRTGIYWRRRPLWVAKGLKNYQSGQYFYIDIDKVKLVSDPSLILQLDVMQPINVDGIDLYVLGDK